MEQGRSQERRRLPTCGSLLPMMRRHRRLACRPVHCMGELTWSSLLWTRSTASRALQRTGAPCQPVCLLPCARHLHSLAQSGRSQTCHVWRFAGQCMELRFWTQLVSVDVLDHAARHATAQEMVCAAVQRGPSSCTHVLRPNIHSCMTITLHYACMITLQSHSISST